METGMLIQFIKNYWNRKDRNFYLWLICSMLLTLCAVAMITNLEFPFNMPALSLKQWLLFGNTIVLSAAICALIGLVVFPFIGLLLSGEFKSFRKKK